MENKSLDLVRTETTSFDSELRTCLDLAIDDFVKAKAFLHEMFRARFAVMRLLKQGKISDQSTVSNLLEVLKAETVELDSIRDISLREFLTRQNSKQA